MVNSETLCPVAESVWRRFHAGLNALFGVNRLRAGRKRGRKRGLIQG